MRKHPRQFLIPALLFTGVCSLTANTLCVNKAGTTGCSTTIGAAVAAASAGDTIIVEGGTYKEVVTIGKSLRLLSMNPENTVIDATGLANGVYVDGVDNPGLADVMVSGFTIKNANAEGILVSKASTVVLSNNRVVSNNVGVFSAKGCPSPGARFGTCGDGIRLLGADHCVVANSFVSHNAGGISITDGPALAHHNVVIGNVVEDNDYDGGINLVSANSGPQGYGVSQNTISRNTVSKNGYPEPSGPGSAAGIGIYGEVYGSSQVLNNVVIGNKMTDNDGGILMETQTTHPYGNVLAGNSLFAHDVNTGDGVISIASPVDVSATVIGNEIAIEMPVGGGGGTVEAHFNSFPAKVPGYTAYPNGDIGVLNYNDGGGVLDATENWWGCPGGPTKCSSALAIRGGTVPFTPWLTAPPPAPLTGASVP